MSQDQGNSNWSPYADGTSGHQGGSSKAAEPSRRRIIDMVLDDLREAGARGLTWRDLSATYGMHHGQASSALSNLHRSGAAVRLQETRERCGVYVTPGNTQGRLTVAYRRQSKGLDKKDLRDAVYTWTLAEGLNYSHPSIHRLVDKLEGLL